MADQFWISGHLLAASCARSVSVFNPFTQGAAIENIQCLSADSEIASVQWARHGGVLTYMTTRANLLLYRNGACLGALPNEATPPCDMGTATCMRLSRDSKMMFTGSKNSQLFVWDLQQQVLMSVIPHHAPITSLAVDDTLLASATAAGGLSLYGLTSFQPVVTLVQPDERRDVHSCLSFSTLEAGLLATTSLHDPAINLWSTSGGRQQHTRLTAGKHLDVTQITGLTFSPLSASVMMSCGVGGQVLLWDRRAASSVQQQTTLPMSLTSLGIRDDGIHVAVGAADGTVTVIDARTMRKGSQMQCQDATPITDIQWQPTHRSKRQAAGGTASAVTKQPAATTAGTTPGTAGPAVAAGVAAGKAAARPPAAGLQPAAAAAQPPLAAVAPRLGVRDGTSLASRGAVRVPAAAAVAAAGQDEARQVTPASGAAGAARTSSSGADSRPVTPTRPPGAHSSLSSWLPNQQQQQQQPATAMQGPGQLPDGMHAAAAATSTGQHAGPVAGHAVAVATTQQSGVVAAQPPPLSMPLSAQPSPTGMSAATMAGGAAAAAAAAHHYQYKATSSAAGSRAPSEAGSGRADAHAHLPSPGKGVSDTHGHSMALTSPSKGAAQPSPAGQKLLHEPTFRAVIEDAVSGIKEDIRSMHIELVRQHHMQQVDMVNLLNSVAARQTELQQDVRALKAQLDRLTRQQAIGNLY